MDAGTVQGPILVDHKGRSKEVLPLYLDRREESQHIVGTGYRQEPSGWLQIRGQAP
jgi:hypothetical protein